MYFIGDVHLGAGKRNKQYYSKFFYMFERFVDIIYNENPNAQIMILGDLFDESCPEPHEYDTIKQILYKYQTLSFHIIPGNHDLITIKGVCASKVLQTNNLKDQIYVYQDPVVIPVSSEVSVYLVPYSGEMFNYIKTHPEFNTKYVILASHFTTLESNKLAGLVSEQDPMFDRYDVVILSDCHSEYDHGKFHTTGSTYFTNVDEMLANTPQCLKLTEQNKLVRIKLSDERIPKISSELDAIDDSKIYIAVTNDSITKPNVFVKNLSIKRYEEEFTEEVITKTTTNNKIELLELGLTDVHESIKIPIRRFIIGEIDVDQLIDDLIKV